MFAEANFGSLLFLLIAVVEDGLCVGFFAVQCNIKRTDHFEEARPSDSVPSNMIERVECGELRHWHEAQRALVILALRITALVKPVESCLATCRVLFPHNPIHAANSSLAEGRAISLYNCEEQHRL